MPHDLSELITDNDDSDKSSDSDQEYKINRVPERNLKPSANAVSVKNVKLDDVIKEINENLENDRDVDLSKYPPLYIVNFRGVHFFRNFFDKAKRKLVRKQIIETGFHESIYSAAIYELAGLAVGESIDTEEKKSKIQKAREDIKKVFKKLESADNKSKAWYGEKKVHTKLIYQHYQRYVNTYEEFRAESLKKEHSCYKEFPSTNNPYVSTADEAKHAVTYALGFKSTIAQGALRPSYQEDGSLKHPKVGYVQVILQKLGSFARYKPLMLSSLHASNIISIKYRTLNERETTFKGAISAKHIVSTAIMRFPAWNKDYNKKFHPVKYGITNNGGSYTKMKSAFKNAASAENKISLGTTKLVDNLVTFYADSLQKKAESIVADLGGYLVYLDLDGTLRKQLPSTFSVSDTRRKDGDDVHEFLEYNLEKFISKDDSATDSEEEFPAVKKSDKKAVVHQKEEKKEKDGKDNKDEKDEKKSSSIVVQSPAKFVANKSTNPQRGEEKSHDPSSRFYKGR